MATSTTNADDTSLPKVLTLRDAINRSNKYIRQHTKMNINAEKHEQRIYHTSTASWDSNNPSLQYNEYDSDSSRDEEMYISYSSPTSNQPVACSPHTNMSYEFHVAENQYVPLPDSKQISMETDHSLPDIPANGAETEQFKIQQNTALRHQNEYLHHQLEQHIHSPVSVPVFSPTISADLLQTPPLPVGPVPSHHESKADVYAQIASHAPSQSITEEILFEFVAVSDDEYAVDISAKNKKARSSKSSSKHKKRKHHKAQNIDIEQTEQQQKKKRKKQKASKNRHSECDHVNVKHCNAVKRLAKAMTWYQKYAGDADKLYAKLEEKVYVDQMLNDYQHVLDVHLQNDSHVEYQQIRERVYTKLKHECDAHSCTAVKRLMSNQYEGGEGSEGNIVSIHNMKDKIEFYAHSMDLIHCYLLHLECLN